MRGGKVKGMKRFGMYYLLHFGRSMIQGALRYVCCLHDGTAIGGERDLYIFRISASVAAKGAPRGDLHSAVFCCIFAVQVWIGPRRGPIFVP